MPSASRETRPPRLRRRAPQRSRARLRRSLALLALALLLADAAFLGWHWLGVRSLASGPIPRSSFMRRYEAERRGQPGWPPVAWQPVPLARLPQHLLRAVIVAEDSRFWDHRGVDLEALRDAMETNLARRRFTFGGSTISQQTAKNLFLSPSRDPLRKWHELVLTFALERELPKRRILEIYLNIAELGRGIYGVEAASQAYFGIPASRVSLQQAAELAATLPSPKLHNPRTRSAAFERRVRKIRGFLARVGVAQAHGGAEPKRHELDPAQVHALAAARGLEGARPGARRDRRRTARRHTPPR